MNSLLLEISFPLLLDIYNSSALASLSLFSSYSYSSSSTFLLLLLSVLFIGHFLLFNVKRENVLPFL